MKLVKMTLTVVVALMMVACAKDGDSVEGVSNAENFNGGYCDDQVISDYNDVVFGCSILIADSQIRECRSKAQSFVDTYPGLKCMAKKNDSSSIHDIETTVTNQEFIDLINKIDEAGY